MPELPEVETVCRQLKTVVVGKTAMDTSVNRPSVFRGNPTLLTGKTITGVTRIGKMIVLHLTGNLALAVHLKMTGRLVYQTPGTPKSDTEYATHKHTHIVIGFDDGSRLYFHDQRRFGWVALMSEDAVISIPYVRNLGPEFLGSMTLTRFSVALARTHRPVKSVILDQERMAGLGNIYANEALWCAKINPKLPASTLSGTRVSTLFSCIETILTQAIALRGTSSNNYRDAFGQKGGAQNVLYVYGKTGTPCPRCGTPIERISLGGRGTFCCPTCQK